MFNYLVWLFQNRGDGRKCAALGKKKPERSFQASPCCWDSFLADPAKFKSLGLISAK